MLLIRIVTVLFFHETPIKSEVTLHILQNRHEYGPIEHLMTILKPLRHDLTNTL
jgi:hypothetical protein